MALAFALRTLLPGHDPADAESRHLLLGVISLPVWVVVFSRYRLYSARHVSSRLDEFGRLAHAAGVSLLVLTGIAFSLRLYVARGWLVLSFVIGVVLLTAERELARRVFNALRRRGHFLRRVVIVGANQEGHKLGASFAHDPSLGYQ